MTVESVLAHGLKTSVFGSQWNVEYAENLALLDPDRITSGPLAGRPAAGAARRFYFATDAQALFYDTGAAWVELTAAPGAHAASHASGGADAVMVAQSQVANLAADLASKAAAAHTHAEGDITNLLADLASKAAAAHTHAEADITNLAADLAAKAPAAHSHAIADIATLQASLGARVSTAGNESIGGVKAFTDMTKFSRGVQAASAATLNLSNEDGIYFNVTGTATINAIATRGATGTGAAKGILPLVILKFDGALTVTHNAASLILPGGASIVTHAGMVAAFAEESAGNWRCIGITGKKPVFKAAKNAAQPLSAGGWTKIQNNTVACDTNGNYDNATNFRYTPTVAGYYHFIHNTYAAGIADQKQVGSGIYKNGAAAAQAFISQSAAAATDITATTHLITYMNGSTDYVEAYAYNGDTGARNFCHSSGTIDFFSGHHLGIY